ncbi:MAG: phosphoenolpyruvate--protein phosphotransferase [Treponema sp.]|jgi:phosphotransferase system enzyme I (PtsI)|nr:phosphoenolpyruvate--protein phosphotransferase [Treponema sp.]
MKGISVCPGRVLEKTHLLVQVHAFDLDKKIPESGKAAALKAIDDAIEQVVSRLRASKEQAGNNTELADLFDVQETMILDPFFHKDMEEQLAQGYAPAAALMRASANQEETLRSLEDEYMSQRADDIRDIAGRTAYLILGLEYPDISRLPGRRILAGEDLMPSMLLCADVEHVAGIVIEKGTRTSHVAILASSLEIPMVVGCKGAASVKHDSLSYLDAAEGIFETGIRPEDERLYAEKIQEFKQERDKTLGFAEKEAETADGERVQLLANIIDPVSLGKFSEYGLDGVGLFRTEFLYMNRGKLPTENEQFTIYKQAAEKVGQKPLVIRTLDIGGDKEVECLKLPKEENPFMGFRAIRICLKQPDLMNTQIRAILRASVFGDVRVMFPMVATAGELDALLEMVSAAKKELRAEAVAFNENIKIGIMVEIPSVVILLPHIAPLVDFVSIGSNDLIQYTYAADRNNKNVGYLYDFMDPAVLWFIKQTIDTADKAGIECSLCGEMAGDPMGMALLLALGLRKFSVSASLVLSGKRRLSLLNAKSCAEAGKKIAAARDAGEVAGLIRAVLPGDYS